MTHEQKIQAMTNIMTRFTGYTGKYLPDDIIAKLRKLREQEDTYLAKVVYDSMFENQELAAKLDRPCCQDTGVIQYYVKAGSEFPLLANIQDILHNAVLGATQTAPLRHNAVEIFKEKNTGNNTGERVPIIDWEIVPASKSTEIEVYMAGGGCSLLGQGRTLMPSAGYEGIVEYVFDVMTSMGLNACPPLLVGIGIAGSIEVAARLSKKALFRPIGTRHHDPRGAEMERLLENGLNEVGIGPQGLSGKNSVTGVHIESAARHPSTISVAISVGCWAHRRGTIRINEDMTYEIISHKEVTL
ncbi:L(+)-tartrate dehydratase subunit alpha [Acetonema longum]|uniref:L(+)-tartrate dehydratase subunit alpha n=1 Tax=Acetonema longum DSM 6540 TaxID=1009370 RepID=F7NDF9_9FIRM|nr:L(+)-tartrate dehydratase subunit alpha [Acetonema longum]EGO65912.1 tartrate dehydratase subunit alpha [Acetonema longum DSM 6540]